MPMLEFGQKGSGQNSGKFRANFGQISGKTREISATSGKPRGKFVFVFCFPRQLCLPG